MTVRTTRVSVTLGLLVGVVSSAAARAPALPRARKKIAAGTWVEYLVRDRRSPRRRLVRLLALGHDRGGQWFEVDVRDLATRRLTVLKTLVKGKGRRARVIESIVQPSQQLQPMIVPGAKGAKPPVALAARPKGKLVARTTVRVPAGTFRVRHFRRRGKAGLEEAWFSDRLPGWPLVKSRSPRKIVLLRAHGRGGRSWVRGKPVKIDPRLIKGARRRKGDARAR